MSDDGKQDEGGGETSGGEAPKGGAPKERVVFLTGLSGSGKSAAANCFEDMGFFCSDNIPTVLIRDYLRVLGERREKHPLVAMTVDVRERDFLDQFLPIVEELRDRHIPRPELVYLESSDEVLLRRFSETKRPHPLALRARAEEGLRREKELLGEVRNAADMIIDTSNFNLYQLRDHLHSIFQVGNQLVVAVRSFGYKYGVPLDSDLVFDVRFLRNPYYVAELRHKTGETREVFDYVFADPEAHTFFDGLTDFVRRMLPRYLREGKAYLNIGIGCTGGRHRSVAVARKLAEALQKDGDDRWAVDLSHRDHKK